MTTGAPNVSSLMMTVELCRCFNVMGIWHETRLERETHGPCTWITVPTSNPNSAVLPKIGAYSST